MNSEITRKTCGRESNCDLVIEHPTVSRIHARIELAENGLVHLHDHASRNGMHLNRNDRWIRVRRVTLCTGDRIRLGDVEVPLAKFTAVFGHHANARLEAKHFLLRQEHAGASPFPLRFEHRTPVQKPRRNPLTGKIEEDHSE